MAQGSRSTGGLILGAVLVLLLGGSLAGTPFYLKSLLPPDRAGDRTVLPEVEEVRRIALELDQHLGVMQDIYNSEIPGAVPEQEEIDETAAPPEGVRAGRTIVTPAESASLEQTSRQIREAMTRDKDRGLPFEAVGRKILSGIPDTRRANADFRKTYFPHQDKLIREADGALQRLRSAQSGGHGGAGSLWASRVAATLELAKGELHRQRAEFESREMAQGYQSASQRAGGLRSVRQLQEILAGQKPEEAIAAVDKQMSAVESEAAAVAESLTKLSSEIESKRSRAASLEKTAADARRRMDEIARQSSSGAAYPAEYATLSDSARKAEAEAAALSNGTLAGAKQSDDLGPSNAPPTYVGGEPQIGLRDLEFKRDSLKKQTELLTAERERLAKEKNSLAQWQQQLDERKGALESKAGELASGVKGDVAAAEKYAAASTTAYESAVKSLSSAAKHAKEAITSAKTRTADARQAGSGPKPDERLQRVAADGDPEASMHCLAADVAYRLALCHAVRIDAIQTQLNGQTRLSALTGGETPKAAAEEIDRLRTDAQNLLVDALKSYELASTLISKTNVKFADATVSGKNYLWAVSVGQAAVHLLQAHLQGSDKAEDSFAQKSLAYNLLKEAAKGREQSALLSPAIDAALYLQQSVKKSAPPAAKEKEETTTKKSAEESSDEEEPASKPSDESED